MKVYRAFAYLVALGVVFQAATIAYALFALGSWLEAGNTLEKSSTGFGGESGLAGHGIGAMVVAGLALVFLVVAFVTKVPGGVRWASITFGTVALQFVLGIASHAVPGLGWLHGVGAFAVFAVAVMAGMRAGRAVRGRDAGATPADVPTPVAS
jgi:hypothetical protein